MTIQDCYTQLGGDFNDACSRLMNEALVTRFAVKFPSDPSMQRLREAVAACDIESAFRAVHTLKGVAANLAFTRLIEAASNLTEQLRPRTAQADPELLAALEAEYERTIKVLTQFASEL